MIVAIHQPNLLPWLGYFYKMARADHFVFLDNVPFAKGSYTNRVQIKTATGAQWLTVPVQTAGKLGQPISDVLCDAKVDWRKKLARTLETNYRNCPFYVQFAQGIHDAMATAGDSLAEINIRLIQHVAGILGMVTPTVRSSALQAQGKATDLLIAICRELGADTYLSGSGGANYQDEEAFGTAGIKLIYASYKHPNYRQAFGEFAAGLSIVDLLFNCGPESAAVLGR